MKIRARRFASLGLFIACVNSLCRGGPITVPGGLASGSQYRLVFVTADVYTATDGLSSDYNTYVNNEANNLAGNTGSPIAGLSTWDAIVSTPGLDAIDNVGADPGVPLYDLNGNLVALDASTAPFGLFGPTTGSPLPHQDQIVFDEFGSVAPADSGYLSVAWTGTNPDGTGAAGFQLGTTLHTSSIAGLTQGITSNWIYWTSPLQTTRLELYAISHVLTVPFASVPEPAAGGLLAVGLGFVFAVRRKRGIR